MRKRALMAESFPPCAEVETELSVKFSAADEWQLCTARLTASTILLRGTDADPPVVEVTSPAQRCADEYGEDVFSVIDGHRGEPVWFRASWDQTAEWMQVPNCRVSED